MSRRTTARLFLHRLASCLLSGLLCLACMAPLPAGAGFVEPDRERIELSPYPAGGDFRLDSVAGPVSLQALRGQAVLLFFGYTSCAGICPTTLATLQQALSMLDDVQRARVRLLFVSIDPEHDTPASLDAHFSALRSSATGLSGSPAQVAAVAQQYGVQFRRVERAGHGHGFEHSAAVYLIDTRGRLRLLLRNTATPARFAAELRRLLRPFDD